MTKKTETDVNEVAKAVTMGELLPVVQPSQQLDEAKLRESLAELSPEALALLDKNKMSVTEAASHSMARVHQHIHDREIGMISAHRGENTAEENNHLHHALGQDIRKAGYGHIPLRGHYIENQGTPHERKVVERSYMVVGDKKSGGLKNFLTKHGEKYGQDSVVHKAHNSPNAQLHMTGGHGKGQIHDIGHFHPNRASEFSSHLKGGKKSFTFSESTTGPYFFLKEKSFSVRKEHLYE